MKNITSEEKKLMKMKSRASIRLSIDISKITGNVYFIVKFPLTETAVKATTMSRIVSNGMPYGIFARQRELQDMIVDAKVALPYMSAGLFSEQCEEVQEYLTFLFRDYLTDPDKVLMIKNSFDNIMKVKEITDMQICIHIPKMPTYEEWEKEHRI